MEKRDFSLQPAYVFLRSNGLAKEARAISKAKLGSNDSVRAVPPQFMKPVLKELQPCFGCSLYKQFRCSPFSVSLPTLRLTLLLWFNRSVAEHTVNLPHDPLRPLHRSGRPWTRSSGLAWCRRDRQQSSGDVPLGFPPQLPACACALRPLRHDPCPSGTVLVPSAAILQGCRRFLKVAKMVAHSRETNTRTGCAATPRKLSSNGLTAAARRLETSS